MLVNDVLGNVFDGGTVTIMGRIYDWNNALLTIANTSTIKYTIYKTSDNSVVTGHSAVTLVPADDVFDTLQTTAIWQADDIGFNFRHVIDISSNPAFGDGDLTTVGLIFLVVVTIQPTSGQPITCRWRINVI